jgi:hypothetical protein
MDAEVSQGTFRVRPHDDGRIWIEQPPIVIVPCSVAVQMAEAILRVAGVEVIFADAGQTVIRGNGNGNGKVLR